MINRLFLFAIILAANLATWFVGGKLVDYLNSKDKFTKLIEPLPQFVGKLITIFLYFAIFILILLLLGYSSEIISKCIYKIISSV